jgi:phosphoenolpyruvate synthase/pyruvate phosphate dikinase
VTPDVAIVDKRDFTIRSLEVGDKHMRIDSRAAGGLVRSRRSDDGAALSSEQLSALGRLAVDAEHRLATPIDIEAAMSDRWYLIQARPITTLGHARA